MGAILKELLDATASSKWRERQASHMGLADLLGGRHFEDVGQHLHRLWYGACLLSMCVCQCVCGVSQPWRCPWCGVHRFAVLKGVDDVKDTVRAAAVGALKTVGKLTVQPLLDTH